MFLQSCIDWHELSHLPPALHSPECALLLLDPVSQPSPCHSPFLEHGADEGFTSGPSNCPWFLRLNISVHPNESGQFLHKLLKWGAAYHVAKHSSFWGLPWVLLEWDTAATHPSFVTLKCHAGDIIVETSLLSLELHSNTTTASGGPSFTAKLNSASHGTLSQNLPWWRPCTTLLPTYFLQNSFYPVPSTEFPQHFISDAYLPGNQFDINWMSIRYRIVVRIVKIILLIHSDFMTKLHFPFYCVIPQKLPKPRSTGFYHTFPSLCFLWK